MGHKIIQPFQFKKFIVHQDKCSMKVGTDGVLLGAWADVKNCNSILDIGTGSGLIALMIAQRNFNLNIVAIDIDKDSSLQAAENFASSPWKTRLISIHTSLQNYHCLSKIDLIVSNPPFFEKSLKSEKVQKNLARHNDGLTFEDIAIFAKNNLSEFGKLAVIYPASIENECNAVAKTAGLFLARKCNVKPLPDKSPKRVLLEYVLFKCETITTELVIEMGQRHEYSSAYKELTKEFYLGF